MTPEDLAEVQGMVMEAISGVVDEMRDGPWSPQAGAGSQAGRQDELGERTRYAT